MSRYINADLLIAEANKDGAYGYVSAEQIANTPTADVRENVHGKWEERKIVDDGKVIEEWQSAKCSVCGKYHTTPYLYYFDDFNFCPNCGARMSERSDDVRKSD